MELTCVEAVGNTTDELKVEADEVPILYVVVKLLYAGNAIDDALDVLEEGFVSRLAVVLALTGKAVE